MALTGPEFLKKWTSAVGAGLLAAGLSLAPLSAAYGQSATEAVALTEIKGSFAVPLYDDAHRAADEWVANNPRRVAVAVRVGAETPEHILQNIEPVLRHEFAKQGIERIEFFWETGNATGTGLSYHTDQYVFGPYGLNAALAALPQDAKQMRFNEELALQLGG